MNHPFRFIVTLWQFSRPHTIVGSLVSVSSLYVLAAGGPAGAAGHPGLWIITLLSCLCCNIFITGLNQWSDVDIDKLNKPWLPIPAGRLSRETALRICLVCLASALLLAGLTSPFLLLLIAAISAIGAAYSLPPLRFKRHHSGAATAIGLVRGLMVNIGLYLHFAREISGEFLFPPYMQALTAFITAFSIGIAWFKDIPDTGGDARFNIRTLPVLLNRKTVFRLGLILVSLSYLYMISDAWIQSNLWSAGLHLGFLLVFLINAQRTKLDDGASVKRFYMWFWVLFFAEYIAYPLVVNYG